MKPYNREKREELLHALINQGYSLFDVGEIFGVDKSTAFRIKSKMPKDYSPKWFKKE